MVKIPDIVIHFFERQSFAIVSTFDKNGKIHCSAKGIIGVDESGKIFLMDVYKRNTFKNIQKDPTITVTAINEREFVGYSLKGEAEIVKREDVKSHVIEKWEKRVVRRISERLVKNIQEESRTAHPEAHLPPPQYLIVVKVSEIVDLTPAHIRKHIIQTLSR